MQSWSEYESGETLFKNAVRLRYLIWIIERYTPKNSEILEVGCGSGYTSILLADAGYNVTAIDIDDQLIKRLEGKGKYWIDLQKLQVQKADMLSLPWQERRFSLAFHQGVLEHCPDEVIIKALKEQARVSDLVIFDVPNIRYQSQPFGDERLLAPAHWRSLIQQANLRLINELGRDFNHWLYFLPYALFSQKAIDKTPWFSRWFGVSTIFVCKAAVK
jgi:2-polyprenyl-3-methyl-5-hydroxy-6-metoxy-1,4-benzoquinol methylase